MEFVDTHCHIHSVDYKIDPDTAINNAHKANVNKLICVGTDENDSQLAVDFVQNRHSIWASIGLHPHDAKHGQPAYDELSGLVSKPKVIAIGECGLDYYYNNSPKNNQIESLHFQMQLAQANNLPMIFHVREAFDDFWPIFDQYRGLRGVVHSFTANSKVLEQILSRDLYVGLNGIMTFSKDQHQLSVAKKVPLTKLLLETDAPYLTPIPLRGTINESKNIVLMAEFLANLRSEDVGVLATQTTLNANQLFGI